MSILDIQNLLQQNRTLTEQVQRRVDQLAAVNLVAASVGQSLDLSTTLQTALETVLSITGSQAGGISLIDHDAGEVVLCAQQGWLHDFVHERPMRIPLGKGMSGRVIANDEVYVNNGLDTQEQLAVPSFHEENFRSIAMAPMHARGRVIGILSIMSSRPNSFDETSVEVLRGIADTVGVALDNARLHEVTVENQRRLSAVLHSTADGILATDQNGRIRLINSAAEEMLDADANELRGMPLREAPIQPRVRESLLFALASRMGSDTQGEWSKSFRVSLENGRVLSVLVSPVYVESQLLRDRDADGWVIVLQDVTHLRDAEMARAKFIQTAAHDMRNPLGAALNSLALLRRLLQLTDEQVWEIIAIAENSIERIQALIDDLLALEKLQNGIDLQFAPSELGEIVEWVSAEISPRLAEKNLRYEVIFQRNIPSIFIDREWVTRAMLHYLENAVTAVPPGSRIQLSIYSNAPMLHIEVSDDGPGVPLEAQGRLFERFSKIYPKDIAARVELGLTMVKAVAEAHGGGVYLQSSPGKGSVFGMTLHLAPVEA